MRNRWLFYVIVGLCFGIADWYFLDLLASFSQNQSLNETLLQAPEYIRKLIVSAIVISNYGVWLIPVVPIAISEMKRSHSLHRSALSAILVWSVALLSYYSYYTFMLMFIGLPNMGFMLFSNSPSANYWEDWWIPFKRIILDQFVEWIGIAFFGGAIVGALSASFSLMLQKIVQKKRSVSVANS